MQIIKSIQNRIYEIRGERVMLDFDLAELYEVPTRVLNQAVKRNIKRFPEDFMFRLTTIEWELMRSQIVITPDDLTLRSQIVISKTNDPLRSQIVTLEGRGGSRYLPYAFTEQGIAMLSSVLNSDKAIQMNIAIMRGQSNARQIYFCRQSIWTKTL